MCKGAIILRLLLAFNLTLVISNLSSQTSLFTESFDDGEGATTGTSVEGVGWSAICYGCSDGGDWYEIRNGWLENHDSGGPSVFTTDPIIVSGYSGYEFIISYEVDPTWSAGMENSDDCTGCLGNPYDPLQSECVGMNGCWDFLFVQLFIDGVEVKSEIIGESGTDDSEAAGEISFDGCFNGAGTVVITVTSQTWADGEYIRFDDIELLGQNLEAEIVPSSYELCEGEELVLEEVSVESGVEWEWVGPIGTSSDPLWTISNVTIDHTGPYSVTVTDEIGCESTHSVDILVNPTVLAELVSSGETELCLGNCTTIRIETVAASGNHEFGIDFGEFGTDFFSTPSLDINVCYNGSGSIPVYDAVSKSIVIPENYPDNSIEINLDYIENEDTGCEGSVEGAGITIDLIGEISATTPSPYSLCEESPMMATFDLTIKDNEVIGTGSGDVRWYLDSLAINPIPDPATFSSFPTTVYAQIDFGNCSSPPVPLDLVVTEGETGNIYFTSLDGLYVCDGDGNGDSVRLELNFPNEDIEYILSFDFNLDGTASTSSPISSLNEPVLVFPNVKDSLSINITDVEALGTCEYTGETEDITVYVVKSPDISPFDSVRVCGYYVLDKMGITNGTGSQAYYTMSGGLGPVYNVGDTLYSDITLYAYDEKTGCTDEEELVVDIIEETFIDPVYDTTACDFVILPPLGGINLVSGIAYFDLPEGGGAVYLPGDTIRQNMTLFPYDSAALCVASSDSFNLAIVSTPDLSAVQDFSSCNFYVVDSLGLRVDSLLLVDQTTFDTLGLGDTIFNDIILGIEARNQQCYFTKSINLTITGNVDAGTGITDTLCIVGADSISLSDFIIGPFTGGGIWRDLTGSGALDTLTGILARGALSSGSYPFEYYISDVLCGVDSTIIDLTFEPSQDAGVDSSYTACGGVIDIAALHLGEEGGSYVVLSGETLDFSDPSQVDVSSLVPGAYQIDYIVGSNTCIPDTAAIVLEIVAEPEAGKDNMSKYCRMSVDSIDLGVLLLEPFDTGGTWQGITDTGIAIDPNFIVALDALLPGINQFQYIVSSPVCGNDTSFHALEVFDPPFAGKDTILIFCGDDVDLATLQDGDPGGNYSIDPPGAVDFSDPSSVSLLSLDPGNYRIEYVVPSAMCGDDTSMVYMMVEDVVSAGTGMDLAVCEGTLDSIPLNTLITGASSTQGIWNSLTDTSIIISNTNNFGIDDLGVGSYQFEYVVVNVNCGNDTSVVTVDILNSPYAGRDTIGQVCGGLVDITAYFPGSNAGGAYSVSPDAGIDLSAPQAVDISSVVPGVYDITYAIDAPGCPTSSATAQLLIEQPVSAGLDTTLLRCDEPLLIFQEVLRGHDQGGIIIYDGFTLDVADMIDLDTTSTSLFLYVVDGGQVCPSDTSMLVLESQKTLEAGTDTSYTDCMGEMLDLDALLNGNDPGGVFEDQGGNTIMSTMLALLPGETQNLRYVVGNLCSQDTALLSLTNVQYNTFGMSVSDASPCLDDCIDINVIMEGAAPLTLFYTITDDGGTSVSNQLMLDGVKTGTYQMCVDDSGMFTSDILIAGTNYTVSIDSLSYSGQCRLDPDVLPINIRTYDKSVTILDTMLCAGESFFMAGMVFNEAHPSDTITFFGQAANFCDSILIVNAVFEDKVVENIDSTICIGDEIMINGTAYSANNTSGRDTFPGGSASGCDSIVLVNITLVETTAGLFQMDYCDIDEFLVIGGDTFDIDTPEGMAVIPGGNAVGCDSLVDVQLTYLEKGTSTFDTLVCDPALSFAIGNEVFDISNPMGMVALAGMAANGCDSIVEVNIRYDIFEIEYEVLPLLCPDDEVWGVTIISTTKSLPLQYQLGGMSGTINSLPFLIEGDSNDDPALTLTDAEGCMLESVFEIGLPEPVSVQITSTEISANNFQLELVSEENLFNISWDPSSGLSCSDCTNPLATPFSDITYRVTAFTGNGCIVSDTISLRVDRSSFIFIPNVFSPNADGINDTWYIGTNALVPVDITSVSIFDRWGNLVFNPVSLPVTNTQTGWDGTYKGQKLNPGVYVYLITYRDEAGQSKKLYGDLTIIK